MSSIARSGRRLLVAALAGALALSGIVLAPAADAAHPAGRVGKPIVIATKQSLDGYKGYDVAADAKGNAFVAWISTHDDGPRQVHLCTILASGNSCSGGVQTIDSLDPASAADLRVLSTPDGHVTLVWYHEKTVGPDRVGEIAEATALHGLHLSAAQDVADAPSNAELLATEYGPHGAIWTVTSTGVTSRTLGVRPGFTAAVQNVHVPFAVGFAQLAFVGSQPVMTAEVYGSIGDPPSVTTTGAHGAWLSFVKVPRTWAVGTDAALVHTGHGLRLITGVNNASYRPVMAKWNGRNFVDRHLTADDNNCAPNSHDGWTDASGRLLDASWECGVLTISNYQDASHAALYRGIRTNKTTTFTPQIAASARGLATVVYSYEGSVANTIVVQHVRLGVTTRTVRKHGRGGTTIVRGPVSCLPAVQTPASVSAQHDQGWTVASKSLRLGSHAVHGSIDGATLKSGKSYTLRGAVTFKKGTARHTVKVALSFTTC